MTGEGQEATLHLLRQAWRLGRTVDVTYATGKGAKVKHKKGRVERVSTTGAFVIVGGLHVPADRILKVKTTGAAWPPKRATARKEDA